MWNIWKNPTGWPDRPSLQYYVKFVAKLNVFINVSFLAIQWKDPKGIY